MWNFLAGVFYASQNNADNEQVALPGYRDRIVNIKLRSTEGGMNLAMPQDIIENVALRGAAAAQMLTARFNPRELNKKDKKGIYEKNKDPQTKTDVVLDWDNHRWVRYRAFMAALEAIVTPFDETWNTARIGTIEEGNYAQLLNRAIKKAPSYKWANRDQQTVARQHTKLFLSMGKKWQQGGQKYGDAVFAGSSGHGASPSPKPRLRMMPNYIRKQDPPTDEPATT